MPLPKILAPHFKVVLPTNGKTLSFRPFTVREEKLLLMAPDDDEAAQVDALRQVLMNCLDPDPITGETIDVNKLAMCDLDYLWLKIRSKSVEEIVNLPFECHKKLPEGETRKDREGNEYDYCGTIVNVPINLEKIEVTKNPKNTPVIKLQDNIGIKMRYPTFEVVQKLAKLNLENSVEATFEVISECVDLIFEGDKTYEREHVDKKEMIDFLESLPRNQFAKIMEFFETLPTLRHQIHFRCPKCKHEVDIVLEGTKSFLASDSATKP